MATTIGPFPTYQPYSFGPSYLLEENFEGSGYENAGWVEEPYSTGIINPNEASSPAPLRGFQSLSITQPNENGSPYTQSPTGFNLGTAYGFLQIRHQSALLGRFLVGVDTGQNSIFRLQFDSTGAVHGYHGALDQESGGGVVTFDHTYFVWWQWEKGAGTGIFKVWVGDTRIFNDATLRINMSNGDANTNLDAIRLQGPYSTLGYKAFFDQVIVNNSAVGDVAA